MTNSQRPMWTKRHNWMQAALGVGGIALLAACGSSTTSGSTATPASPPVAHSPGSPVAAGGSASPSGIPCAQITSLRTSLTNLIHLPLKAQSAGQATADLQAIEKELGGLASQAGGAFSAQASQLSSALHQIGKDLEALARNPSSANATALSGSVQKLKTTSEPMIKEMKTVCP